MGKIRALICDGHRAPYFIAVAALALTPAVFVLAQTITPSPEPAPAMTAPEEVAMPADTAGPQFISIAAMSATSTEATVAWTTDEPAYGFVQYGQTIGYGNATAKSASAALEHMQSVTGLEPGTQYHYRVVAEDTSGNTSYSEDRILETAVAVVARDNTPPEISSVRISEVGTSTATISWTTDELAQGRVEYGLTENYGAESFLADDYALDHMVSLSGSAPGTEYHFRVVAEDASGNSAVSPDEIFTTDAIVAPPAAEEPITATSTQSSSSAPSEPAPAPFDISHAETESIGTSTAVIIWRTNEPADAQVSYGTTEDYASSTPVSAATGASHRIAVSGLRPGTNYFYKVISKNAEGKSIFKSGFEFNTLFAQKKLAQAPVISSVAVSGIGTSTAVISWITDLPAAGEVRYGTTTAYGKSDGGHANLLTAHTHPLSGLAPGTAYHFLAIARSAEGNETIFKDTAFVTLPASADAGSVGSSLPPQETVTDETTATQEQGGASGGYHAYTYTSTLLPPAFIKSSGMDAQAMFVWTPSQPAKARPGLVQIFTNVFIVRNFSNYPSDPSHGKIIYKGNRGIFTDTGLENGTTYYYSAFLVNQFNSYSYPVRMAVTPKKSAEEMKLEITPPAVQKNPLYAFPADLKKGDRNKSVEHLQVLLASDPALHPTGLITGYFGDRTRAAVRAFQARYGLTQTGAADAATRKKLEALSAVEVIADRASVFDAALRRDLSLGSQGGDVAILQRFLAREGAYSAGGITGYFGALTKKALQKFQQEQNISSAGGYFGPLTKKRMLNLIRLRAISL